MTWRKDDELQQMLRESARSYFGAQGGPAHLRKVLDGQDGHDPTAWQEMAELGWTGIILPEAVGGAGLGMGPALTLAEEFGAALAPEPFVASAIIAGTVLTEAASNETARKLMGMLARAEAVVTLAWQEERNSAEIGMPAARLTNDKLNGTKLFVPAWTGKGDLIVSAMDEDDSEILLAIATSSDGITALPQRMTDGTTSATVIFTNVAVERQSILLRGDSAGAALRLALARGKLALAAQLDGLATTLWNSTADYLKQRVQFEHPIADFQAIRHRLVDLHAGIELAAASWRRGFEALEAGNADDASIASAKARCSDAALEMARAGVQLHGAFGYTTEADVGLYLNTALRWASWLGNAQANRRCALAMHTAKGRAHG